MTGNMKFLHIFVVLSYNVSSDKLNLIYLISELLHCLDLYRSIHIMMEGLGRFEQILCSYSDREECDKIKTIFFSRSFNSWVNLQYSYWLLTAIHMVDRYGRQRFSVRLFVIHYLCVTREKLVPLTLRQFQLCSLQKNLQKMPVVKQLKCKYILPVVPRTDPS